MSRQRPAMARGPQCRVAGGVGIDDDVREEEEEKEEEKECDCRWRCG